MTYAHIHRFGDCVALTVGDDSTRYLTPEEARAVAASLARFADDVDAVAFTDSQLTTSKRAIDSSGHCGRAFKVKRPEGAQ